jgi:hypothetical protein
LPGAGSDTLAQLLLFQVYHVLRAGLELHVGQLPGRGFHLINLKSVSRVFKPDGSLLEGITDCKSLGHLFFDYSRSGVERHLIQRASRRKWEMVLSKRVHVVIELLQFCRIYLNHKIYLACP